MIIHVLRVPTVVLTSKPLGERWCFVCRKRVEFWHDISGPADPLSYYGPHSTIRCEVGHRDGDCFPGTWREWSDPLEPGCDE